MKTFLSIGTGPGIGAETARRFAAEGFRVVIAARDHSRLQTIVDTMAFSGNDTVLRTVDASDPDAVSALINAVKEEFGSINVLHYNAGNIRQATLADQAIDTLVPDLAVNIGGAMAAIKASAGHMAAAQAGTILLTGGGFALAPHPGFISISVGKAGIRALALGLFEQMKADGIHLATVTVAGVVETGSRQVRDIAEHFWSLHSQAESDWTAEVTYLP
ncbi:MULTISPECIES: SDR family NAD(P)-dependent oxidoreductase [Agrobacterium]|uniref:SDR family NAD(P)-dependent oxidoreductase n=1 Tax=Agrobacterium rubi TaxID=28099 RepID=A0AAE7RDE7_9HYPH|nr:MULTISPECIES: SDR family NAD(P)-dependent oxidoreductase [Agrobacterium]MBN7807839.1 SDR family NAD(P)-dependent oxidoreductase [Agrobacterium rosae]NTE89799.1 SDR family NAD(P)-dependent oxidoreductase [Agrobacterium rubi]NTF05351.1 SDR family NAD(P)-dependent oxidoreductase [Agrobacterium rubi]NTF39795.1 SDR family NAD(P)-dependent oxidoreductase [Agrobacterium rubi]OCJ44896.1 short-chain dehydrogenase [Agrobacterium rubi]